MKKFYLDPEMEIVELETQGFLADSTGTTDDIPGGDDGNIGGGDYTDPSIIGGGEGL